jgi:CRISPR-associated protein Csm5
MTTADLMAAANESAERALRVHLRYAEVASLDNLHENLTSLLNSVQEVKESDNSCLVCLGWGAGFLSKSGGTNPPGDSYRQILGQLSYYAKAIRSGLPFPKTRRIVFLEDRPATLPGWARLEIT